VLPVLLDLRAKQSVSVKVVLFFGESEIRDGESAR